MSELILIGNAAMTSSDTAVEQVTPEDNTSVANEANFEADETINDEALEEMVDDLIDSEALDEIVDDAIEGDVIIEPGMEEGEYTDPGFAEDGYVDPGFYEGGYMEPGMETGMVEVKDPLLSSWPFVIGISAAVLVVSIALGALLAKLKIKKGIDLYED